MKFIYLNDVHIKGVNPGRRKDVYYVAILKKLMEIGQVIKAEKIDFAVIGGDLFDVPKVSNKLYGQIALLLRSWGVQIFVVPGNHDVYGQNIDTLEHSSLGALSSSGVVKLMIRKDSPYYFQKKSEPNCPLVAITAQEYYNDIDRGINCDYEVEPCDPRTDIQMLVVHGMLVDKGFHPDVAHTVMSNVTTSADVILSSHYHPDNIDKTYNGTRFIKSKSTARLECTKYNVNNKPGYAIIEVNDKGITNTFRDYTVADKGEDIFDYEGKQEEVIYKNTLDSYKKSIQDIDVHESNNINDILNKVAHSIKAEQKHIAGAVKRITAAQQTDSDEFLNGYVPKNESVQITKVVLHNFEGHKNTTVEFKDNCLNALIGESGKGKTAILRGIKWVLYNEPKGDENIKHGEKNSWVQVFFSTGDNIKRYRTKSTAGYYEVYDNEKGETTKLSGFSHTQLLKVFNIHQMPKVKIGKKQLSYNIAEQLEGPYMLSSTANERAVMIGKITGCTPVDIAVTETSKDISNLQKSIKGKEREIEGIENKMLKFDDLPDIKKEIDYGQLLLDQIDSIENDILDLNNLEKDINAFNTNLILENQKYAKFNNLNEIGKVLEELEKVQKELSSIEMLESEYIMNCNYIFETKRKLNNYSNLEEINKILLEAEKVSQEELWYESLEREYINNANEISFMRAKINGFGYLNELKELIDNICSIDSECCKLIELEYEYNLADTELKMEQKKLNNYGQVKEEMIIEIENISKQVKELEVLEKEYSDCNYKINSYNFNIGVLNRDMEDCNNKYKELLKKLGKCPICNSDLNADIIEHVHING